MPLKILEQHTSGSVIQEMDSGNKDYFEHILLTDFAGVDSGVGTLSVNPADSSNLTHIGTFTDTKRNNSEIYGATKAGLIQLTKYFAARYAHQKIRVNCIAPGGVLNEALQGEEFIKNYSNLVPMKRLCESKEVSQLCYLLASNKIGYLTGQTISLDGGMTSW